MRNRLTPERYGKKMVCKNCGSTIFEGDKFCCKCGMRVVEEALHAEESSAEPEAAAGEAKPDKGGVTEAVEPAKETASEQTEEKTAAEQAKAEESDVLPPGILEEKPGKAWRRHRDRSIDKPGKWFPRVLLCILGAAVLLLIANSSRLINSYHRNFSTPEEYYRWVEQKSIRKNAKILAEYYANYFVEQLHRYDAHMSGEIRVELGDAGRDMMELAGVDLSWFEKGAFTFESVSRDGVQQSVTGLEIGGEKLLSTEAIIDLKDEAAYLGFPELSQSYLAVDTGPGQSEFFYRAFVFAFNMTPEEYLETMELLELLYRECPDRRQVEALANRYLELLLNSIDNVKLRTGKTARVGDISQSCTTLKIYLDKNDLQDMLRELLKELQEDREIERLLIQVYDLAAELDLDLDVGNYRDGEEFYEAFQDNIDDILDDMDYYVTYHDELEMTVYVDDRGQIIGRVMEFPNSWDEVSISWLNPHRGSRFGYRYSITEDGGEVSLTGSGRKFGNKVSGSFTVRDEVSSVMDIEVKGFDMNALRKGYVNGRFIVTPSSGFGSAFGLDFVSSYLRDMELVIDVAMGSSSEKLSLELREDKELWGALTVTVKRGNGRKISVPSTRNAIFVDDWQDWEDWWDTLKWSNLLKKMNKAGLPAEAVDAVEEISEMDVHEIIDELRDALRFLYIK